MARLPGNSPRHMCIGRFRAQALLPAQGQWVCFMPLQEQLYVKLLLEGTGGVTMEWMMHLESGAKEAIAMVPHASLQAAVLIGSFAMLLTMRREAVLAARNHLILGSILGGTGLCLNLLSEHMQRGSGPIHVYTDFIFWSGLLGGWRNALIAMGLLLLGRVPLLGMENLLFSTADVLLIATGSVFLGKWILQEQACLLTFQVSLRLVFLRAVLVLLPPVVVLLASADHNTLALGLVIRRFIGSFTFSPIILFCCALLMQRECNREVNTQEY